MLKTLDRYILKKFLTSLIATITAFSVIVLVVDFVERGWRMVEKYDVGFDIIAYYYVNYMPFYVILAFPVAMLVSTLFSIGSLAKNRELAVMKASGLSLYRISLPILTAAFLLSIGVMLFAEFILTDCEKRKTEIKSTLIENRQKASRTIRSNVKVQSEDGWIIIGNRYDVNTMIGTKIKVHKITENSIVKTYIAEKIVRQDSTWILVDGSVQEFINNISSNSYAKFDSLALPFLKQTPEMMAELPISPRETDFFTLLRKIEQKKILGEPIKRDTVELYLKITFPFANFILVLIGIPLAANPRRSGPSVGFGISIIISFIFFVLIRTGQSLGNNGKLPPLLAASLGNIVFLIIGFFMLFKARK